MINQSLAIIEYSDEAYPQVPLLPGSAAGSGAPACDCADYRLRYPSAAKPAGTDLIWRVSCMPMNKRGNTWFRHWVKNGLEAVERMVVRGKPGKLAVADTPTLADIFIVPQLANARRVNADLSGMPTLLRIEENCPALPAFQQAAPGVQPDAE